MMSSVHPYSCHKRTQKSLLERDESGLCKNSQLKEEERDEESHLCPSSSKTKIVLEIRKLTQKYPRKIIKHKRENDSTH